MIVTGESASRLSELRKYTVSTVFANQYIDGGSWTSDGVDYPNSPTIEDVVYYLSGIRYNDVTLIDGTTTTFSFTAQGTSNPIFINAPVYKDPKKDNIISLPKIDDDVFIIRQALSVQEQNFRLQYITNLVELTTYAGGNYYNIVNNS